MAGLVRSAATNTLTNHLANGTLEGNKAISITNEDFSIALSKCKPSVSSKEQLHYEKLRLKYASGFDDRYIEMETEPLNEESMETV